MWGSVSAVLLSAVPVFLQCGELGACPELGARLLVLRVIWYYSVCIRKK